MQHDLHPDRATSASASDKRRKLRLISRAAEWIAFGGMALVVAYCAYLWSNESALTAYLQRDVPGIALAPSGNSLILPYLLSLIPVAIFVAAMWEARGLFCLLGKAEIFDSAAPRRLVRLGVLAIAAAVAGIVVRTLVVLVMTSANPAGQRHLVIGIGSDEVSSLIVGLLFLAFALVMQEAARLEDENRSFV
ncbi:DUF2975 domain-containing protein [Methylocapsa aurea]|uniref:DUF2975 domain-containing protein n=1 Tax=Methylocapsa aurea TaxID=663610 RepID=UPI000561DB9A|nr:DUF2975 domain-containing protein [Methylocapsa aurea]